VFFNHRKTATISGYVFVIVISLVAFILLGNIIGNFDTASRGVVFGVSLIPSFALYRGLMYLTSQGSKWHPGGTSTLINLRYLVTYEGPGYRLSNLDHSPVNLAEVYYFLIVEWVVLMIVWAYLEQIYPSEWGVHKHPVITNTRVT
jgi:hypothetical protein